MEKLRSIKDNSLSVSFHPEFASYMIESTPKQPFGYELNVFKILEENIDLRRKIVENLLKKDEYLMAITAFPLLGCENFTHPTYKATPNCGITQSLFYPDEVIFDGHPRFRTLTKNIRERRNRKVAMYVPIYKDKNTADPFVEDLSIYDQENDISDLVKKDHIYLGKMFF